MIGGTNRKSSIALGIAMAGMAFGGAMPASAADLSGGAYADLEERIAELEATTARKGNRKVSLTITGNVNQALFFWDDGHEDNVYVVTNEINPTKIRFHGDAKIADDWKAGYVLELGIIGARQDRVDQNDPVSSSGNTVGLRHSAWYIDSKKLGRVWVGQTSDAGDGILEINLANTGHFASSNISQSFGDGGNGFHLRRTNGVLVTGVQLGDLVIPGWGGTPDSHRYNLVRYDTPTIAGFIASASWGEDDIWNVALRYKGEFSGFQLAAGAAYSEYSDRVTRRGVIAATKPDVDVEEWALGASLKHEPTGLFVAGAYGRNDDNNVERVTNIAGGAALTALQRGFLDGETDFYFIQAGIEKKFVALGATTLYGEYFSLERGLAVGSNGALDATVNLGLANSIIAASEIEGWGLGVNQNLSGAIDVYLAYRHLDIDVTVVSPGGVASKPALESFDYVTAGANIKF